MKISEQKRLVPSNALRHMIQAEHGSRRYTDEEWWHIDRQLPPYCKAQNVPWPEREPVFRKIVERLLYTHEALTRLPAARTIVAAAKHVLRPKLKTAAPASVEPLGRPATAEEVSLIMRGYYAHGPEYAAELGTWMDAGGPHDYTDLQKTLPMRESAITEMTKKMRWP